MLFFFLGSEASGGATALYDKTLYKEKQENNQSKHENKSNKGIVDRGLFGEIVGSRFSSSVSNITLTLFSYVPARMTNFKNI